MNEMIKSNYEPKEVYFNNPNNVKLAHLMYEYNIDLSLLEDRI